MIKPTFLIFHKITNKLQKYGRHKVTKTAELLSKTGQENNHICEDGGGKRTTLIELETSDEIKLNVIDNRTI